MGQGEDDMVMVTGQQPRLLEGEPPLGLEVGALRACPVATRVVPDPCHVAIGTGLHMAAKGRCPALHNGACGSADMGGQGMRLLIRGKGVLEDRLQGHEGHRGLRTRERSKVGWVSLQYHANHPRDKRLVQSCSCRARDEHENARYPWKGKCPVVELVTTTYQTGVKLTKEAMQMVETQIQRLPGLDKWFVDIVPTSAIIRAT